MAQAVKSPEVTRTFETAGSPVAYMDAPEFSKFVAEDSARLIAAAKLSHIRLLDNIAVA